MKNTNEEPLSDEILEDVHGGWRLAHAAGEALKGMDEGSGGNLSDDIVEVEPGLLDRAGEELQ